MTPRVNYHHLQYFKVIAEEGSVSSAAKRLRLGQPTLSAQLRQLEETLNVQLFDRKHRKLILTEQGKIALDYARNIFELGSEMVEVLHDRLRPAKPALCIGALDSVSKQLVLHLVKSAFKIAPCQITLLEGKADELIREVAALRVDLMLTNFLPHGTDSKKIIHKIIAKKMLPFMARQRLGT